MSSNIEKIVEIDRRLRPEVYEKCDAIARIINPAAFADNWTVQPEEHAALVSARLSYQRAVALSQAHEILKYLGLSSAVDWGEILTRLAERDAP